MTVNTSDLYEGFFGFAERPFRLVPDGDCLHWSEEHARAYALLEYGMITRAPAIVLTGAPGTGKTTLSLRLIQSMSNDVTLGYVHTARGERRDVLELIARSLRIDVSNAHNDVALAAEIGAFVVAEHGLGRRVVLVLDEAHKLEHSALDEMGSLTNMNSGSDEMLQVFLVGQEALRDRLVSPELAPLEQRIVAAPHLSPLTIEPTAQYIIQRLQDAGGTGDEFTAEGIHAVYTYSGGVPRLVNKLCELALVYGASIDEARISAETVDQVIADRAFIAARAD